MNITRLLMSMAMLVSTANADFLRSPNGKIRMTVDLEKGRPFFQVQFEGKPVVKKSFLGIETTDLNGSILHTADDWNKSLVSSRIIDSTWKPIVGKREIVGNRCHELKLNMNGKDRALEKLSIVFRAYDDGIAFRYVLQSANKADHLAQITHDRTEFKFTGDHHAWSYRLENRPFGPDRISTLQGKKGYPVAMRSDDGNWLAITEAALTGMDYFDVLFSGEGSTAKLHIDTSTVPLPFTTPWRVLMISDQPTDFIDSDLLVNLSPEPEGDFSWVRP